MPDAQPPQIFRFDDPRQARIFERLCRLIGEGPGQFFRDACKVRSAEPILDARTHLAAHAFREVESALREVLEPFEDGGTVPKNADDGHKKSIRKVCRGLQVPETDPLLGEWLSLTGKDNPDAFHSRAHRHDLRLPRPSDGPFAHWFDRIITIFDVVLERAEASYSVVFRALEALLAKPAPDRDDVDWIRRRVPSTPLTHGYFFDRLEQAAWLEPLAEAGLLILVPPLDRNEEEGTIGFPPWPAKPYLLRMAQAGNRELQESVLKVLKTLPETDNTRVHGDVAEIAAALPPDLARELVPFIDRGLRQPYHLGLPHMVAPLIVYLAGARDLANATSLTKTLFEVLPDPAPLKENGGMKYPPSPSTRIPEVLFEHELERVAPALIAADPCETAETFADLLEQAIKYSTPDDGDGKHSYSQVWWPAIEGPGPRLDEPRDHLSKVLLTAVRACAAKNPSNIAELVKMLDAHEWMVFRRIALHLLATDDRSPTALADAMVTDLEQLDDPETRAEHVTLLRKRFPHLGKTQQDSILAHLTVEPDRGEQQESLKSWLGREVTDEEVEQDIRRRKVAQLRPLDGVLPKELQANFDAMAAEFRSEEKPPLLLGGWGNRSPRSSDELLELNDEDLLIYLKEAKLGHDPSGPSMEGLGDSLADAASRDPERLSHLAERFVGLDPSIVSGLLRGLEAGAKAKKLVDWGSVLRLCRWVVDQPRAIPGRKTRYSDLDPGWAWTRRQIASLLLQALEDQPGGIEISLRSELWPVIAVLLTDPDPEPERTREDDPLTTALNSVRGEAIRAVMAYGLWVRRAAPDIKSFEMMPEVRTALEVHLDPAIEASPAIRAVYGELLALLYHLDIEWLRANLMNIFPDAPAQASLRRGAWDSYVRYRNPLVPMLSELDPEYRKAIKEATREAEADKKPESAARRLAEHIMILAWQGNVPLDDTDGLVATFFREAPLPLRAHAMEFVGRSLMNTEGPIPKEALARVIRLWELRLEFAHTAAVESVRDELATFGWWFASKKFEEAWALAQLTATVGIAGEVDWEHQVIETLAEWAESSPAACVECLDLIMQRERERWGLELSLAPTRRVLESALRSDDQAARQRARYVVNRLVARGHHGFMDLLG